MENKEPLVFFQRKARHVGNYSVEFIFDDIRKRLVNRINFRTFYSTFESTGLFKRLYNSIEAAVNQGAVNHVTGDINYVGLFFKERRTIHTILDCVFLETSSGIKRSILKYFWLTVPVKRSIYITAISTATKKEVLKHVSCDPDKIVVIPVAISERFTAKAKIFNKDKPVILQIGTAPNKNIERLIEALTGVSCVLHIVGKHQENIERKLREHKIEYVFQSGLSNEEMINKYAEADIITLVSTLEGFGMPILEAQATGRPVITSDLLSMPEVAGDAAYLANPFDVSSIRNGFHKIIQDDVYREDLLKKGFENIKRFNAEKIADQYLSLYQKVAAL